jgi:hypothetical protein
MRKIFERGKFVYVVYEFAANHAGGGHSSGVHKLVEFGVRNTYGNGGFGLRQPKNEWDLRKYSLAGPRLNRRTATLLLWLR